MTSTVLVFGFVPCLALLLAAGYLWWLQRAPDRQPGRRRANSEWPTIDLVVPVFNESPLLARKLANVSALRYARNKLRIIVVDGGSTDGSREIAAAWAHENRRAIVIATESPDKAAQLNLALRHSQAMWVVVTDADAQMPAETLQALMRAARSSTIGLVGSPVLPINTHHAEHMYWRFLNWLRVREWRRGSASMVMAPCYAFRRRLIDRIPEDVIGDDVYVAWRIASLGQAVGIAGPVVHEVRGPRTVSALYRQKLRRGSGIVRETFRFLPQLGAMKAPFSIGFLVRAALLLLGPPLVGSAIALLLLAARALHQSDPGATPLMSLGLLVSAMSLDARVRRPLTLGAVVPLAAAVALLMYPVVRRRDHRTRSAMRRGKRRPAYSP